MSNCTSLGVFQVVRSTNEYGTLDQSEMRMTITGDSAYGEGISCQSPLSTLKKKRLSLVQRSVTLMCFSIVYTLLVQGQSGCLDGAIIIRRLREIIVATVAVFKSSGKSFQSRVFSVWRFHKWRKESLSNTANISAFSAMLMPRSLPL